MSQAIDFLRRSGWNLALLLTLSVLVAATLLSSTERWKDAHRSHREASAKLTDFREKLLRAHAENQDLRQSYVRSQELEMRGYIGNENRAEWVAQIDKIKADRKLLDIQYELAPQQLLAENAPGKNAGRGSDAEYEILASNMQLKMQLLHEEDLLNFFSDLRNSVQAIIRVRSCNVERYPHSVNEQGSMAQLMAECSVDWITVREKRATSHE